METKNQTFLQIAYDEQRDNTKQLQDKLQKIIASQDLTGQRLRISQIAQEQNMTVLDCAAALLYLITYGSGQHLQPDQKSNQPRHAVPPPPSHLSPTVRLVRYRLDLGSQHQLSLEQLKKVIVEESGVDIKNIFIVRIQDKYTLVDLPDEMPQEIFHHLKTVEINGKKLDIRRVKVHIKKHSNRMHRQRRPVASTKGTG